MGISLEEQIDHQLILIRYDLLERAAGNDNEDWAALIDIRIEVLLEITAKKRKLEKDRKSRAAAK